MKRRRAQEYNEVLKSLIDAAKVHKLLIKPKFAMIDFEPAMKKAYENTFPGIVVKACLFHFGQSLFKNLVRIGLKSEYLEIPEFQMWFKKLSSIGTNACD